MKTALLLLLGSSLLVAKDVPAWVRQAGQQQTKSDYPAKVTTVTLLQEERLSVDPDGKRVMTERRATKILRASPRAPIAWREYNTKAGKIRDFHAWLLLPSGKVIEYGKDRVLDVSMTNDKTPYDEERAKMIECDKSAPPGSVFAYEAVEEESTIFTTHPYFFQESAPVLLSRFVLALPAGWEARGTVFNHSDFQPAVEGRHVHLGATRLALDQRRRGAQSQVRLSGAKIGRHIFPGQRRQGRPGSLEGLEPRRRMAGGICGPGGGSHACNPFQVR